MGQGQGTSDAFYRYFYTRRLVVFARKRFIFASKNCPFCFHLILRLNLNSDVKIHCEGFLLETVSNKFIFYFEMKIFFNGFLSFQ